MEKSRKPTAHLENWRTSLGYLVGTITNHPAIDDGKRVTTGKLISFNEKERTAETASTYYTLGKKEEMRIMW